MSNKNCILLVDDNEIDRLIAERMTQLLYPDVTLYCFESGEALCNWAEEESNLQEVSNLVLVVDRYMPEKNGFEVIAEFKSCLNKNVNMLVHPFILSAAIDDVEFRNKLKDSQIIDVISKPLSKQSLAILTNYLK